MRLVCVRAEQCPAGRDSNVPVPDIDAAPRNAGMRFLDAQSWDQSTRISDTTELPLSEHPAIPSEPSMRLVCVRAEQCPAGRDSNVPVPDIDAAPRNAGTGTFE